MKFMKLLMMTIVLFFLSYEVAFANEWINDVQVSRLGTYQNSPIHYVWLSSGTVAECQAANPTHSTLLFSEKSENGKSLMAVLMAAVLTKKEIDVQVNGCEIIEVYLR